MAKEKRDRSRFFAGMDPADKKGPMKFLALLFTEFFELMRLNLLFVVTCIGIVTIPAAIAAMSGITASMVQDTNHYLLADYFEVFKKKFGRCLLTGVITVLICGACGASVFLYAQLGKSFLPFYVLSGTGAALLLFACSVSGFVFALLSQTDFGCLDVLKKAVKMTSVYPGRALIAAMINLLIILTAFLTDPGSIIFAVFIMFAFMSLITNFFIAPALDQMMQRAE